MVRLTSSSRCCGPGIGGGGGYVSGDVVSSGRGGGKIGWIE